MIIKRVDYNEIKEVVSFISLSEKYKNFVNKFWQAGPEFLMVTEGEKRKAIIPLYSRKENGLVYLDSGVKLYNEVLFLEEVCINFKEVIDFIKSNFTFDVLDFSLINFKNKGKINYPKFSENTCAYILKIETKNSGQLFTEINKKTRNQIKAAIKNGIEISLDNDIDDFYPIYESTMTRLGAKAKEKKYFTDLKDAFQNDFYLLSAKKDGKIIGGNIFVVNNNYLMLMFNSSLKEYWKYYVNDLLYWRMIEIGLEKGIKWFDFGINARRDHDQIHFKEGFGAKAFPIKHILVLNSVKSRYLLNKKRIIYLMKIVLKKLNRILWKKSKI